MLSAVCNSQFMEQFGSYLGDETRCATVEQVCTVFADGDWIESKDQADDGIRLIQTGNVGNGVYLDKGERARYIDEETFVRLNCTEVLPNDMVFTEMMMIALRIPLLFLKMKRVLIRKIESLS